MGSVVDNGQADCGQLTLDLGNVELLTLAISKVLLLVSNGSTSPGHVAGRERSRLSRK